MKKSELKSLLKIIAEEVIAAKQAQMNETKGLSGMKKAPESTEHTEKVADSKDLTGPAPKEKEEGKKLPVVKKPANPKIVNEGAYGFMADVITYSSYFTIASYVAVLALLKLGKITGGKLPWPWSKLENYYREDAVNAKLKTTEQQNKDMEGLVLYATKRAEDLAQEPKFKEALERNDINEMTQLLLNALSEKNASSDDKRWIKKMRRYADTQQGGDASQTTNLFALILQKLAEKSGTSGDKDTELKVTESTGSETREKLQEGSPLIYAFYFWIISSVIIWMSIKYAKASGKMPWPFNKLASLYNEDGIKSNIRKVETKNKKLKGLTEYCEARADRLAKDPLMKTAIENGDFRSIATITKDRMTEPYDTDSDKYWAGQIRGLEDDPSGNPDKTINLYNRVIFNLTKKVPKKDSQESDSTETPPTERPSVKEEILQMIREEIDEMARVKGAVGSKFKVKDANSPTGWVVMGHKTIPDGTPTEAPKGPYIKKGKYADTAGLPTAPSGSTKKPVSARETELAVADILKYNPNATDEEIAKELASRSENGEPLNLAPSIIAHAIDMTKDAEKSPDSGGDEPAAPDFAAKEKAEKQKKMDRLRSYLMRKRGIKPTE